MTIDARTGHACVALRGATDRRGVLTLGRGYVAVLDVGTGRLLRTVAVRGTPHAERQVPSPWLRGRGRGTFSSPAPRLAAMVG